MSDRMAWLKDRQSGLGATDMASLAGVGFGDAITVYRSKIEEPSEDAPTLLMQIGLATEELNREAYAAAALEGEEYLKPFGTATVIHFAFPWCLCSPDAIAVTSLASWPVELKYTRSFDERWGEPGTNQVPIGYLIQAQWQSYVTGFSRVDISAISGDGEHRIYRVDAHPGIQERLAYMAERFWHYYVVPRVEPIDWRAPLELREEALAVVEGKQVEIPEAEAVARRFLRYRDIESEAKKLKEAAQLRLIHLMGDAQKAKTGGFTLSRTQVEGGKEIKYTSKPYVRLTVKENY